MMALGLVPPAKDYIAKAPTTVGGIVSKSAWCEEATLSVAAAITNSVWGLGM